MPAQHARADGARTYLWYHDPGHAWIRVPLRELADLGISGQISRYSYVDAHGNAYLEEDCDAAIFVNALRRLDPSWCLDDHIEEVYSPTESHVRRMEPYVPDTARRAGGRGGQ